MYSWDQPVLRNWDKVPCPKKQSFYVLCLCIFIQSAEDITLTQRDGHRGTVVSVQYFLYLVNILTFETRVQLKSTEYYIAFVPFCLVEKWLQTVLIKL